MTLQDVTLLIYTLVWLLALGLLPAILYTGQHEETGK